MISGGRNPYGKKNLLFDIQGGTLWGRGFSDGSGSQFASGIYVRGIQGGDLVHILVCGSNSRAIRRNLSVTAFLEQCKELIPDRKYLGATRA